MGSNRLPLEINDFKKDQRTIILAPTGRDAELIASLLERRGIPRLIAGSMADACDAIRKGAGAAIFSEEALNGNSVQQIFEVLSEQPRWSDFPLMLLTIGGRVTLQSERLRELRKPLGNVLLLERPIRPETLLGTLEIALRGRERQYELRDHMEQFALAQEALRRSEKLAVTGRLAASIAHEINNPLESVTNLIYLMRTDPTAEQLPAYLETAEQELARVVEITKHTLRFYREPSQPVATDLATVLDSILTLYHSRLIGADVTVQREVCAPGRTVLCSPGELRQVIANIVGNAIDAMRTGGRLRVRISEVRNPQQAVKNCIRLTIADTGPGIPAHVLPTIFEPFVTTKGEKGTGLGLWVTDEIVKKNGWSIQVHSSINPKHSGTAFSILIPISAEGEVGDCAPIDAHRKDSSGALQKKSLHGLDSPKKSGSGYAASGTWG